MISKHEGDTALAFSGRLWMSVLGLVMAMVISRGLRRTEGLSGRKDPMYCEVAAYSIE